MGRNFIQETIDTLNSSAKEIEKHWKLFQEGKINKETFEKEYHHVVEDWLKEMVETESHNPNNGCKYCVTCPTSKYFKEQNI